MAEDPGTLLPERLNACKNSYSLFFSINWRGGGGGGDFSRVATKFT